MTLCLHQKGQVTHRKKITEQQRKRRFHHFVHTLARNKSIVNCMSHQNFRQLDEFQGDSTLSLVHNGNTRVQPSGGIRLFGSSSRYLSADTVPSYKKAKRQVVHDDDDDELKKCQAVAVSPEWVMSRKEVSCWEKPSREVLVLNASGEVIRHKGAKTKMKTNSRGVRNDSFRIDAVHSALDVSNKRNTKTKKEIKTVKKVTKGDS